MLNIKKVLIIKIISYLFLIVGLVFSWPSYALPVSLKDSLRSPLIYYKGAKANNFLKSILDGFKHKKFPIDEKNPDERAKQLLPEYISAVDTFLANLLNLKYKQLKKLSSSARFGYQKKEVENLGIEIPFALDCDESREVTKLIIASREMQERLPECNIDTYLYVTAIKQAYIEKRNGLISELKSLNIKAGEVLGLSQNIKDFYSNFIFKDVSGPLNEIRQYIGRKSFGKAIFYGSSQASLIISLRHFLDTKDNKDIELARTFARYYLNIYNITLQEKLGCWYILSKFGNDEEKIESVKKILEIASKEGEPYFRDFKYTDVGVLEASTALRLLERCEIPKKIRVEMGREIAELIVKGGAAVQTFWPFYFL